MKVELTYDTPEPSWLSIKQQIEAIPDFCDEVTLQVSKPIFAGDRVFRFLDRAGIPIQPARALIPTLTPTDLWSGCMTSSDSGS
jgi:hypothetical protein